MTIDEHRRQRQRVKDAAERLLYLSTEDNVEKHLGALIDALLDNDARAINEACDRAEEYAATKEADNDE